MTSWTRTVTGDDGARPAAAGAASSDAVGQAPLLQLRGIGKSFGPVRALTDIDLDVTTARASQR